MAPVGQDGDAAVGLGSTGDAIGIEDTDGEVADPVPELPHPLSATIKASAGRADLPNHWAPIRRLTAAMLQGAARA
jgi:hypothetical protein